MQQEVASWQVYYYRLGDNNWSNAQSSAGNTQPPPGAPQPPNEPPEEGEDVEEEDDLGLPTGVRLVLSLPGGTLTRDLQLPTNP